MLKLTSYKSRPKTQRKAPENRLSAVLIEPSSGPAEKTAFWLLSNLARVGPDSHSMAVTLQKESARADGRLTARRIGGGHFGKLLCVVWLVLGIAQRTDNGNSN